MIIDRIGQRKAQLLPFNHNHFNFQRNKTRNRGSESKLTMAKTSPKETLFRVKIPTALETPQFCWEVVECYYGYFINSVIGGFN